MGEKLSDSVYWRMVDRYVDVTQWTTARKVALMMMLALPFHVGFGIFSHVVLREAGGTIRREAFDAVQAIWLLAIGVVMGLAWWAGRKGRDAPWTAILLIVGYGTPIALMLHVTGTWGSPFIAFYPLALMLVTLFVGPRAGVMAFAYGTLLLSVLTALEMTAVLPYASVFIDRSLEAQATPAWVTSQAGFILIVFVYYVAVLGFAAAARERAQQRLEAAHAELTEARVHLERANYLVSRYVAAQCPSHVWLVG